MSETVTLQWVDAEGAKRIPRGSVVLVRCEYDGVSYEVDDFHRPDWVHRQYANKRGRWSLAVIEDAKQ